MKRDGIAGIQEIMRYELPLPATIMRSPMINGCVGATKRDGTEGQQHVEMS